ncbi:CvpA family protein [Rhodocaloribacter litoris]|uniref:CvpA family protein n=1 Tax=Rhodocaloribacter litoris TaxID=2558931 RepID=UPI0014226B30|nr:CvpA family protein [Rhodocaloribacter litoris]QXD16081.1 CvpA family protein [Rhodocaloribacter litoris]
MNTLDLLILFILLAGAVHGFSTGLIRQVASVVSLVLAFILGVQFMTPVGDMAAESLGLSDRIAPLVGFILVFMAIQIAVFALARMVEGLVGVLKLTFLNRLGGGALGAFKAALALSVVFLVLHYVGLPGEELEQGSVLYDPVAGVLPRAWDYVSERVPQVESLSEKFGEHVRAMEAGR